MEKAMDSVRSYKAGIDEAARMYNVPPTTLKDRISGGLNMELGLVLRSTSMISKKRSFQCL